MNTSLSESCSLSTVSFADICSLDQHIINFRNRKVTTELEQVYRTNATEAGLRIFCISNIIYWKNRALSLQDSLEYLQLSNILDLRRYCIGIVAESHLRATEKYIRDEIPAFLGSVQLWIEAGSGTASAERKQQVLDVVSTIEQQLDDVRNGHRRESSSLIVFRS